MHEAGDVQSKDEPIAHCYGYTMHHLSAIVLFGKRGEKCRSNWRDRGLSAYVKENVSAPPKPPRLPRLPRLLLDRQWDAGAL